MKNPLQFIFRMSANYHENLGLVYWPQRSNIIKRGRLIGLNKSESRILIGKTTAQANQASVPPNQTHNLKRGLSSRRRLRSLDRKILSRVVTSNNNNVKIIFIPLSLIRFSFIFLN